MASGCEVSAATHSQEQHNSDNSSVILQNKIEEKKKFEVQLQQSGWWTEK